MVAEGWQPNGDPICNYMSLQTRKLLPPVSEVFSTSTEEAECYRGKPLRSGWITSLKIQCDSWLVLEYSKVIDINYAGIAGSATVIMLLTLCAMLTFWLGYLWGPFITGTLLILKR